MPNYHYQAIFEAKRSTDPLAYSAREDELLGEYSLQVDQDISECEEIISNDNQNHVSEQEVYEAIRRGLPLISIKYSPDRTRYKFIEGILTKLERCASGWGTSYDLTDERIGEIYDEMISSTPIEQVLSKFTLQELRIYGW
jgi:hypothetical protein